MRIFVTLIRWVYEFVDVDETTEPLWAWVIRIGTRWTILAMVAVYLVVWLVFRSE